MADFVAEDTQCANGMPGYLAVPKGSGKVPAVIILHERYGFGQHQRDIAERFAKAGIAGFAVNAFYKCDFQDALASGTKRFRITDPESVEFVNAAIHRLKQTGRVDASKIAFLGMCQTGRHPLIMAAEGETIAAAICWYGAGSNKEFEVSQYYTKPLAEYLAKAGCPILGIFGALDAHIPVTNVRRIRDELEKSRKPFEIYVVEGAPHGFLNSRMPKRYRHEQSEFVWKVQMEFLNKAFHGGFPPGQIPQHYRADLPADENAPFDPD
jgi:carboxymethylenebutenolidase